MIICTCGNTYLNVTFEDLFSNAPTLAKIEFGNGKFILINILELLLLLEVELKHFIVGKQITGNHF